jgi:hypothetical protein
MQPTVGLLEFMIDLGDASQDSSKRDRRQRLLLTVTATSLLTTARQKAADE